MRTIVIGAGIAVTAGAIGYWLSKPNNAQLIPGNFATFLLNERAVCLTNSSQITDKLDGAAVTAEAVHQPPIQAHPSIAIRKLDVSRQGLSVLTVEGYQQLEALVASANALLAIPPAVCQIKTLAHLDLGNNRLTCVPDELGSLVGLTSLNLMGNTLTGLPESFGKLTNLKLLGLKSNKLRSLPESFGSLISLVELFITDNALTELPASCTRLTSLVKLQASFNCFTALPPCLAHLPKLEMARFAVCNIQSLPASFALLSSGSLLSLAWCSLAGNPACPAARARASLPHVEVSQLQLGDKLGEGASGEVCRASYNGQQLAMKFFRADVSPDGRTEDELAVSCAVDHPHLTRVVARVEAPPGLLLELVQGTPMALKPTSQHLLRCKWGVDERFPLPLLLRIMTGVAEALEHCHSRHIAHGDVYAHNVLVDAVGKATLCDFGASFAYPAGQTYWEAMEVRAYGLMLRDMVARLGGAHDTVRAAKLWRMVAACTNCCPAARPSFASLVRQLQAVQL